MAEDPQQDICVPVSYAQCKSLGNGPISAAEAIEIREGSKGEAVFTCYACGNYIFPRRKHKRRRGSNEFDVRACFSHLPRTKCSGNESVEHLAAKDALCLGKHTFSVSCQRCHADMTYQPWKAPHAEDSIRFATEIPLENKRLDVAVVLGPIVLGAIEVLVTHPVDQEKINVFTRLEIPWCEVKAVDVLAASSPGEVRCVRAALTHCDECMDAIRKEFLETRIHKITEEATRQAQRNIEKRIFTEHMNSLCISPEDQEKLWEWRWFDINKGFFDTLQPATVRALGGPTNLDAAVAQAEERWRFYVKRLNAVFAEIPVNELADRLVFARIASKLGDLFPEPTDTATAWDLIGNSYPEGVLDFGKHKGLPISYVWEIDKSYIRWLAGYTGHFFDKRPEEHTKIDHPLYKKQAREYLQGHCYKCFKELEEEWHTRCRKCYRLSCEEE